MDGKRFWVWGLRYDLARSQAQEKRLQNRLHVFALCALGILVTVFDTSAAVVALPTIAAELGADLPFAQWVIVGNNLTIAALLVPMGRLGDLLGRKRLYIAGCILVAIGAGGASMAPSVGLLIAARAGVGIGSAMTQGTAMAIVVSHFGAGERASALGWQTAAVGLGATAGPALGGLIVSSTGWRTLFVVTAVAMGLVAVAGGRVLRARSDRGEPAGPPFDFVGAFLFAAAIAAGLLSLTLAPRYGWSTAPVLGGAMAFALLATTFVIVERCRAAPMIDLTMFRNATLALGAIGILVAFMGVSAARFLTPFFLQQVRGLDPSAVGLLLMPAAIVTALVSPFAGRLADRFGTRELATIGFAVAVIGLLIFTSVSAASAAWIVCAGLVVIALGLATFSAPNSASIFGAVDAGAHGLTAALVNLSRNMGNVIGVSFATTIVAARMTASGQTPTLAESGETIDAAVIAAFMQGFWLAFVLLAGLALAVLMLMSIGIWRRRRRAGD
jgi:EmrB/QacA subfamily drug resistance transporter